MALKINGVVHPDGAPTKLNGAQLGLMKVNGVVVWRDANTVELPQFNSSFTLADWLETNHPGTGPIKVINNFRQPSMDSGDFLGREVELVNENEFLGTNPGSWAMTIQSTMKLTNNFWIRGAGGNAGNGGNGGLGGQGGKGADVTARYYSFTVTGKLSPPGDELVEGWMKSPSQNWSQAGSSYVNFASVYGPSCIDGRFDVEAISSEVTSLIAYNPAGGIDNCWPVGQEDPAYEDVDYVERGTYRLNYDIFEVYDALYYKSSLTTGGSGGAGGPGGTSVGTGGLGQCFTADKTDGTVGGAGTAGTAGSPSNPTGGNSGGQGGTGGKAGNGGNGGDWGLPGNDGATGDVGGTGSQGAGGGDAGLAGSAGTDGTSGLINGAGIVGTDFLTSDSLIGYVDGGTIV